eukprot:1154045-Pelagomonas_calceolata.AAC.3
MSGMASPPCMPRAAASTPATTTTSPGNTRTSSRLVAGLPVPAAAPAAPSVLAAPSEPAQVPKPAPTRAAPSRLPHTEPRTSLPVDLCMLVTVCRTACKGPRRCMCRPAGVSLANAPWPTAAAAVRSACA